MGTYGPRPFDTLDFARAAGPREREEPSWAVEEDVPRSRWAFSPPSRLLLAFEIFVLVIVVGAVAAYLFGWGR